MSAVLAEGEIAMPKLLPETAARAYERGVPGAAHPARSDRVRRALDLVRAERTT